MPMTPIGTVLKLLVGVGFLLPAASLLTIVVLYSQNSLYVNGRWIVEKRMMQAGLMGADEYLLTRVPLAGNVLNLGSYFGFQHVVLRQKLIPRRIEFRVEIPEQSYVDVIYSHTDSHLSGVRLSRRDRLPSITFEGTPDGAVHSSQPLPVKPIPSGWQRIVLDNTEAGLRVAVEDDESIAAGSPPPSLGHIGFRSGIRGARIDDVVVYCDDESVIREGFGNTRVWPRIFGLNILILVLLSSPLLRLGAAKWWPQSRVVFFHWTMISLTWLLAAVCWYVVDFYFYSHRTFVNNGITHPLGGSNRSKGGGEAFRHKLFSRWFSIAGGEVPSSGGIASQGYPMERVWNGPIYCDAFGECRVDFSLGSLTESEQSAPCYRMLFIGGSQTVGSGARTVRETFFVRTHTLLRSAMAPVARVESLNVSFSGYSTELLAREYRRVYDQYDPDVVVVNSSTNDTPQTLITGAIEILELNKAAGIRTLFLEEPNSREAPHLGRLIQNHRALRNTVAHYGARPLPLHQHLERQDAAQNGVMWWDFVHLTSYGHHVTAEWLAPRIIWELNLVPLARRSLMTVDN